MKITFLNGSPKSNNGCSSFLLQSMESRLPDSTILWHNSTNIHKSSLLQDIYESQALLIAFPLYADGIPSHLLNFMQTLENDGHNKNHIVVYIIINCGFYEGAQNKLALEMFQIWAKKCGFKWGYGIGIGAGGMLPASPIGKGPNTKLGKIFDAFALDIQESKSGNSILTGPDFPRFLYKRLGHMNWKKEAKKHNLSAKDLRNRLI